jgi:hypothetical protein
VRVWRKLDYLRTDEVEIQVHKDVLCSLHSCEISYNKIFKKLILIIIFFKLSCITIRKINKRKEREKRKKGCFLFCIGMKMNLSTVKM